jgi:hypothetical protein
MRISVSVLMAPHAKSDEILGHVITLLTTRLNVMDLQTLPLPAPLATPAIHLQDFAPRLAISFRIEPQTWPLGTHPGQSVTWLRLFRCGQRYDMSSYGSGIP